MDTIEFGSSLNLDEVVEATKPNSALNVALYYGKAIEDTVLGQQNDKVELVMNTVAENLCINIRETWNAVENISIIQRINDENVIICISCNDKKTCTAAVDYAVEVFSELTQACVEQQKKNDNLKTTPKQHDFQADIIDDEITPIPRHMIQIQATTDQINKRIQSFMERKREQVNMSNIKDFCIREEENEMCARVDAVLRRRKDAKSHIQVSRVVNNCGPQMWTIPIKKENSIQHNEEGQELNYALTNSDVQMKGRGHISGLCGKRAPSGTISTSDFVPLKIKQESGSMMVPDKTTPTEMAPKSTPTEPTPKVEKPFKITKRTFSVADLDSKLEILKRRVLL